MFYQNYLRIPQGRWNLLFFLDDYQFYWPYHWGNLSCPAIYGNVRSPIIVAKCCILQKRFYHLHMQADSLWSTITHVHYSFRRISSLTLMHEPCTSNRYQTFFLLWEKLKNWIMLWQRHLHDIFYISRRSTQISHRNNKTLFMVEACIQKVQRNPSKIQVMLDFTSF